MKILSIALLAFALLGCSEEAADPMGVGMAGSGAPPAAACSGKPGALRGRSMQALMAGGLNRSFIYYAPPTLDPNTPAPVVIVPHGYTMTADMMFEITKYSEIADREKFVVMFPNGQQPGMGAPWNVGNPDCKSSLNFLPLAPGDDNAFIDAMLAFAEADQCLDKGHVFMTGFSMGGYFSNESGCMRADIRGIAPHSGGTHDFATCKVTSKPVMVMHFEGDALIPYTCGTQTRDRWAALNKCESAAPDVMQVQGGRCEYYKGCTPGGQVAMCSFTIPTGPRTEPFAGHAWSGGSKDGVAMGAPFAIPETASASTLGWEFFKKYAW